MFNVEASIFNASLLGSSGVLKYVRMSSSVTCQAVKVLGVLTVGAPRFILHGSASASSSAPIYKARMLKASVLTQAIATSTASNRRLARLSSSVYPEASSSSSLRRRHPVRIACSANASASSTALIVAKCALRGSFTASAGSSGVLSKVKISRFSGSGMCFTTRSGRIYGLLPMSSNATCTATSVSKVMLHIIDAVPDRTMVVDGASRLMVVQGVSR